MSQPVTADDVGTQVRVKFTEGGSEFAAAHAGRVGMLTRFRADDSWIVLFREGMACAFRAHELEKLP